MPYGDLVYGAASVYGGDTDHTGTACTGLCGDGWRVEAVDFYTGRIKAVLHPITMDWEVPDSSVGVASIMVATRDPSADDIWPHETAVYISRILPDGTRFGHYGGIIEKFSGSQGGATSIGLVSVEEFLFHRLIANRDEWLRYEADDLPQATVAKQITKLAIGAANRGPLNVTCQALNTADSPTISVIWRKSDFKNIGEAIQELVTQTGSLRYRLEHTYDDPGYWSTNIVYCDTLGEERDYTLRSDFDADQYGLEIDAKLQTDRVYGVGKSEGADTMYAIAFDKAETLPEYQSTQAWKDVAEPATLDAYTVGQVQNFRDPLATPTMTLPGLEWPEPDILQTGDTVGVNIEYGVLSFAGACRVLSQSWTVAVEEPVRRTLAFLPVVRPSQSVRLKTPSRIVTPVQPIQSATPNTNPTADQCEQPGLVTNIQGNILDEVSGMQYSRNNPGRVWVHNDESENPQVFLVRLRDGAIKGSYSPRGWENIEDPEAIRIHPDGRLFLADIGDNDDDRSSVFLYATVEPDKNGAKGVLPTTVYELTYPGSVGSKNAETLLIHPVTGEVIIITKESGGGRAISFGTALSSVAPNSGVVVKTGLPALVSDGTFTHDGKRILLRAAGVQPTYVYGANWNFRRMIDTPAMSKSEAITVEPSGCGFLTSTESKPGTNPPIYRVRFPWIKAAGETGGTALVPAQILNLKNWKLTLPTPLGGTGTPDEVRQPALATYEHPTFFYTTEDQGVVFNAPVSGATTSNSGYPRSELREMTANGADEIAWSAASGTHTMEVELAFTELPGLKPQVVGMQIHDDANDISTLRLEGTNLYVTQGNNTHYDLIMPGYTLGTRITVRVTVSGGMIEWFLNNISVASLPYSGPGNYFKTGCYTQANESNGTGQGEVIIYDLSVSHT